MSVCPIITREPLDRFSSNFDWGTRGNSGKPQGRFGFEIISWVDRLLLGKIAKTVIYDKARVNGGTNQDYPGQRWVPKIVSNKF